MKISELFEAFTPPTRNPKLGFRTKGSKIPVGGTKEWLKAFGATATDVDQALRVIRQSAAYRALKELGMVDESTDRHNTLGSIVFVGSVTLPAGAGKTRDQRLKVTVQANGKMDETRPNDWHRAPISSKKPHIVPGDAVQSIVKTMTSSLELLAKTVERRKAQGAADIKKAEKEQEALITYYRRGGK